MTSWSFYSHSIVVKFFEVVLPVITVSKPTECVQHKEVSCSLYFQKCEVIGLVEINKNNEKSKLSWA